jgi:CRP-like cAMP-binding protein
MARVSAFDPARRDGARRSHDDPAMRKSKADPPVVPHTLGPQPNIFSGLNARQIEIVTSCAEVRKLRKSDLLFMQGTAHDCVFIIQSGIIRTFFVAPKGREITLAYWRPGNLVGTPEVLSEGVHPWSGEAVVPTEVLLLKCSTLRSLIGEIPQLALGVIEALEFKGKCFSGMVQMLGTMTVSERIVESLRTLADVYGTRAADGIVLRAPFTHEALANMVGASRQWVTMELHSLEKRGVIRISTRAITVIAPALLNGGA